MYFDNYSGLKMLFKMYFALIYNYTQVDYAFTGIANSIAADMQRVDDDPVLPCSLQGPSLMLRKDNTAFTDWFNPALAGLMKSPEYRKVCNDLINEHGKGWRQK